jgi:hypothetical protein
MKSAILHRTKRLYKNREGSRATKSLRGLKELSQKITYSLQPREGTTLILYISATHAAVSGALMVEKEIVSNGKVMKQQFLVYFVLEILTASKRFYSKMENIGYAIFMSACKLRHYFEAHTIKVLTNQPLNDIFGNRDSSGRISKWATELSEHVVDFKKCSAIKF